MKYLVLAAAMLASACAFASNDIDKVNGGIHVSVGDSVGNASTVNGSIEVDAGAKVSNVETVNGHITLGDGASAAHLETVNGGIELGANVQANEIETVNGRVRLGKQAMLKSGVDSVNAHVTLQDGASIGGSIENVNGTIELVAATVAGHLETVNGDITVGERSRVENGILVKKPNGGWFSKSFSHNPRIVIGPGAVVRGTLKFEHEVDLYVSDTATVGEIVGATAKKFSGSAP